MQTFICRIGTFFRRRSSNSHNKRYMEVTMRTKLVIPTVLLIAAALLSACSGSIQFGQAQPRTISVNGNAQVILAPDIAYISIGVHSEAKTATEAVASNNTQTQAVIDAIKSQGVDVVFQLLAGCGIHVITVFGVFK